jgi:acetyl-CoA synthetase
VVGATDRPGSYGELVMGNLERWRFAGPVWGVNPKRREVHGFECVPSVLELPEPVDAVVVAIPAAGVPQTLEQAIAKGCGGAVVVSAGFGEVESGRRLEDRLREVAVRGGLPVCGPNGNGIVAAAARAPLWGDSVQVLEPGPVAMVSQSGNVAVNALGSRRGIGWHTIVSGGNQAVLDASDWLETICAQDGVRSVALFLESDGDGARLATALARCAEQDVGVAILKVGSSAAGAAAASAHTGSLAGDQRVFRALVEEAGAAWCSDVHELLEVAKVLAEPRARPRGGGGAAVLTCSGGDSGVAADLAESGGVELPALSASTSVALADLLPEAATIGNPLDYTAMIWGDSDRLRRIVATVGADPAIDQLLLLYDHPNDLSPESEATWQAVRDGIVAGAAEADAAALVASTLPDLTDAHAITELAGHGVPLVSGLATALVCVRALRGDPGDPARLREISAAAARAAGRSLQPNGYGEAQAKALLREAGIAVPPGRLARDADDAVAAAGELGWPVALKLSGPAIQHKSDAGALALGLGEEAGLRDAWARLAGLPAAAGAEVLVETMMQPGVELLIAARADGVVPALVLALGGVWTEALDDVAVVPLPARPERVERALRSLRGAPLLTGARGADPVDLAAVAELGAACGEVLLERGLGLLELNPVVAAPEGAVALDAVAG